MNKIKIYNDFTLQIKEGLIKTYPIKSAVKSISRELSLQKIQYSIDTEESTNTIFIKILSSNINNDNILNIFRQINLCGYFISNYDFYDSNDNRIDYLIHKQEINDEFLNFLFDKISNSNYTQLTIESKYNKEVNVPDKLYHVTKESNKSKILKLGLSPRSKNKRANHFDRIYLGYNPTIVKNLSFQFEKDKYILLEIDTTGLNIELYDDPDFSENGGYTYSNIPPTNIKIIDNFEVS